VKSVSAPALVRSSSTRGGRGGRGGSRGGARGGGTFTANRGERNGGDGDGNGGNIGSSGGANSVSTTSGDVSLSSSSSSSSSVAEPEKKFWQCEFCHDKWKVVVFTSTPNCVLKQLQQQEQEFSHGNSTTTNTQQLQASSSSSSSPVIDIASCVYDSELELYFDSKQLMLQFQKMRSVYCVICDEQQQQQQQQNANTINTPFFENISLLQAHLTKTHHKYLCDACLATRKIFPFERQPMSKQQLLVHYKNGDAAKGLDGGTNPHPFCEFCVVPFYSKGECGIYVFMRACVHVHICISVYLYTQIYMCVCVTFV
jgi:hypothetical protein